MANAPLDENSRQGATCALNTDGKTITPVTFDPTTHGMRIVLGTGQADNGNHDGNALIDDNGRASMYGLSSTGSGTRIIGYANSSGFILIQKT